MADQKPELQEPKAPDYQQDIHTPTLEEIMEEAADEEDAKLHPVAPVEAKPDEKPVEETKPVEEVKPVVEPAPALDEDKLTNKIVTELVDKLAPAEATKEEKKDLQTKLKELQKKAEDEGREMTYPEALEFLAKETKESVKAELKDELKQEVLKDLAKEVEDEEVKAAADAKTAQESQQKLQDAWNKQWDSEFGKLEESGRLPKINEKDVRLDEKGLPVDPGRRERYHLLTQMQQYNIANQKAPILNLVEFHALHYKSPSEMPAGAKAPVAGARRAVTPTNTGEFSYQDIHSQSLEDIMSGN